MAATKTGFAEINGANIYYEVAGEGHPFVMVHAAIADNTMWDAQFNFFAQKYKVIRYDMRGFGKSEPVPDDYQRHEDLRALMDHLKIDSAYLMGCSMGGGACMNFALEYPDRTNALIMVGSGPAGFSYDDWSPSPLDEEIDAAYAQGDLERVAELGLRIFIDGTGRQPDQVDPALRKKIYELSLVALKNESKLGKDIPRLTPAAKQLESLRPPVLIVLGDLDEEYINRAAAFMEANISDARKIVMKGTAHLPNMEFPDQFNEHVRSFLDGLPANNR